MTDISRRKLFGAAGAASLGLAGMVPVASASECGKPVKWNETKEFVIIGTGFAGLAAALEAHQGGMKSDQILILEKMSFPGGNSVINGGARGRCRHRLCEGQKVSRLQLDPLLHADITAPWWLWFILNWPSPTESAVNLSQWQVDKDRRRLAAVTYHGGHSVIFARVESNSGAGFILLMLERLKEVGTAAASHEGRAAHRQRQGLRRRRRAPAPAGYRLARKSPARSFKIRATKGVLLATW